MNFLTSYELSLASLGAMFILPAAYFAFHAKLSHRADLLQTTDASLEVAVMLLVIFVTLNGAILAFEESFEYRFLAFLHLGPLVLTHLIIVHGRESSTREYSSAVTYKPMRKKVHNLDEVFPHSTYKPRPQKTSVERKAPEKKPSQAKVSQERTSKNQVKEVKHYGGGKVISALETSVVRNKPKEREKAQALQKPEKADESIEQGMTKIVARTANFSVYVTDKGQLAGLEKTAKRSTRKRKSSLRTKKKRQTSRRQAPLGQRGERKVAAVGS